MKTTVSEKGQVTIPKKLRTRLGIRRGTVLVVEEDSGRLVFRKAIVDDPVTRAYGVLQHIGRTTDDLLKELRYQEEYS